MSSSEHWLVDILAKLLKFRGEKSIYICNGGLSVSGLQHIGRLRGEIVINDAIISLLEENGLKGKHTLVLYTQDPWKGKDKQLSVFKNPDEAKKYISWPLIMVPDPFDCCNNWVEHFWKDFGNYLELFTHEVDIITTTDLYKSDKMKNFIKTAFEKRESIRSVINKYRGRKPYHENWLPFEAICENCNRIGAESISADISSYKVRYKCHYCGHEGETFMWNGKLTWRLEWISIWYCLNVDFEPFGKDHAMPGGSRDSCVDLSVNVFNMKPPLGLAYEWVGYYKDGKDAGDMGSSDFIGFSPKEWVEVAEPEVLRFLYLFQEPMKRIIIGLENIPQYTDQFDRVERLYYGVEKPSKRELPQFKQLLKSFKLAHIKPLPYKIPIQLPYLHAVALIQTLPKENLVENAIARLRATKFTSKELLPEDIERIKNRLNYARNWLQKYAPEVYRIKFLEVLHEDIINRLNEKQIQMLSILRKNLENCRWIDEELKNAMIRVPRANKEEERQFFEALYLIFFGQTYGPRISPYLSILEKTFVLNRIDEVINKFRK
ncbi:MAG: lysine--tRNA ligase [Candidatus Methanomethylicia archaeon]